MGKKIKPIADWQFYELYHDDKYIKSHDTRKTVVLKEPKESREYRLINNSEKDLVVYAIDGGLICRKDISKCDFAIYTEDRVLFLIELKGAEYTHAIEQLLSSVELLIVRPQVHVDVLNARVVLSKMRVPDILSTTEKKLIANLKKYGRGALCKKCRKYEEYL